MRRNGAKHNRVGHGTGVGIAKPTLADRLAAHNEAKAITARVFSRLHDLR